MQNRIQEIVMQNTEIKKMLQRLHFLPSTITEPTEEQPEQGASNNEKKEEETLAPYYIIKLQENMKVMHNKLTYLQGKEKKKNPDYIKLKKMVGQIDNILIRLQGNGKGEEKKLVIDDLGKLLTKMMEQMKTIGQRREAMLAEAAGGTRGGRKGTKGD
nr:PREDICTED: uncharacterized protein LOC105668011 [Linepithema humile]XP_012215605.1 PREDICTED: uncharacterized protein LOC105668011 [Linepithema humile]